MGLQLQLPRRWTALLIVILWCQQLLLSHCLLPDPLEGFPGGHFLKTPKDIEKFFTSGAASQNLLGEPSPLAKGPWLDATHRPLHRAQQDSTEPSSDGQDPGVKATTPLLETRTGSVKQEPESATAADGQLSFAEEPEEHAGTGGPIDWEGFGRALFPDEWFPSASRDKSDTSDTSASGVGGSAPDKASPVADPGPNPGASPRSASPTRVDSPIPAKGSPEIARSAANPVVKPKVPAKTSSGLPTVSSPLSDLPLLQPFKGMKPNNTLEPLEALVPALGFKKPLEDPLPADAGSRLVPTFDKSAEGKCRGKPKGFNSDPDSPTCFLWCMATSPSLLDGVPRGFRSCCPTGMCFQAANPIDPLGNCGPCPAGEPAPPPPVVPKPVTPLVTRQPGEPCNYTVADVSRGGISQKTWRYTRAASVVIAPTPGHLVFQTQWNVTDAPFGGAETTLDTVPGQSYSLSYAIENHPPCKFNYALFVDGVAVHFLSGLDMSARVERAHTFISKDKTTKVTFNGYTTNCNGALSTDVNSFSVMGPDPKTCSPADEKAP